MFPHQEDATVQVARRMTGSKHAELPSDDQQGLQSFPVQELSYQTSVSPTPLSGRTPLYGTTPRNLNQTFAQQPSKEPSPLEVLHRLRAMSQSGGGSSADQQTATGSNSQQTSAAAMAAAVFGGQNVQVQAGPSATPTAAVQSGHAEVGSQAHLQQLLAAVSVARAAAAEGLPKEQQVTALSGVIPPSMLLQLLQERNQRQQVPAQPQQPSAPSSQRSAHSSRRNTIHDDEQAMQAEEEEEGYQLGFGVGATHTGHLMPAQSPEPLPRKAMPTQPSPPVTRNMTAHRHIITASATQRRQPQLATSAVRPGMRPGAAVAPAAPAQPQQQTPSRAGSAGGAVDQRSRPHSAPTARGANAYERHIARLKECKAQQQQQQHGRNAGPPSSHASPRTSARGSGGGASTGGASAGGSGSARSPRPSHTPAQVRRSVPAWAPTPEQKNPAPQQETTAAAAVGGVRASAVHTTSSSGFNKRSVSAPRSMLRASMPATSAQSGSMTSRQSQGVQVGSPATGQGRSKTVGGARSPPYKSGSIPAAPASPGPTPVAADRERDRDRGLELLLRHAPSPAPAVATNSILGAFDARRSTPAGARTAPRAGAAAGALASPRHASARPARTGAAEPAVGPVSAEDAAAVPLELLFSPLLRVRAPRDAGAQAEKGPGFTPSPGTLKHLATHGVPDFFSRQTALLEKRKALMEAGQHPQPAPEEEQPAEGATGKPALTPVAARLHRSLNDLEQWQRRRDQRLAIAAQHARMAEVEEEAAEATFRPTINERSRKIAERMERTTSPRPKPWASPPPASSPPGHGHGAGAPSHAAIAQGGPHTRTTIRAAPFGTERSTEGGAYDDGQPGNRVRRAMANLDAAVEQLSLHEQGAAGSGAEGPSEEHTALEVLLDKLKAEREALAGVHSTEEERASYAAKYMQAKMYLQAAREAAELARNTAPPDPEISTPPQRRGPGARYGPATASPRAAGGFRVGAFAAEPLRGPLASPPKGLGGSGLGPPSAPASPAHPPVTTAFSIAAPPGQGTGAGAAGGSAVSTPRAILAPPATAAGASSGQGQPITSTGLWSPGGAASDDLDGSPTPSFAPGVDGQGRPANVVSYAASWRAQAEEAERRAAEAAALAAEALARQPPPPLVTRRGLSGGGAPMALTTSALAALASQQYTAQAAARIRALVQEMEADRLRHEQEPDALSIAAMSIAGAAGSFPNSTRTTRATADLVSAGGAGPAVTAAMSGSGAAPGALSELTPPSSSIGSTTTHGGGLSTGAAGAVGGALSSQGGPAGPALGPAAGPAGTVASSGSTSGAAAGAGLALPTGLQATKEGAFLVPVTERGLVSAAFHAVKQQGKAAPGGTEQQQAGGAAPAAAATQAQAAGAAGAAPTPNRRTTSLSLEAMVAPHELHEEEGEDGVGAGGLLGAALSAAAAGSNVETVVEARVVPADGAAILAPVARPPAGLGAPPGRDQSHVASAESAEMAALAIRALEGQLDGLMAPVLQPVQDHPRMIPTAPVPGPALSSIVPGPASAAATSASGAMAAAVAMVLSGAVALPTAASPGTGTGAGTTPTKRTPPKAARAILTTRSPTKQQQQKEAGTTASKGSSSLHEQQPEQPPSPEAMAQALAQLRGAAINKGMTPSSGGAPPHPSHPHHPAAASSPTKASPTPAGSVAAATVGKGSHSSSTSSTVAAGGAALSSPRPAAYKVPAFIPLDHVIAAAAGVSPAFSTPSRQQKGAGSKASGDGNSSGIPGSPGPGGATRSPAGRSTWRSPNTRSNIPPAPGISPMGRAPAAAIRSPREEQASATSPRRTSSGGDAPRVPAGAAPPGSDLLTLLQHIEALKGAVASGANPEQVLPAWRMLQADVAAALGADAVGLAGHSPALLHPAAAPASGPGSRRGSAPGGGAASSAATVSTPTRARPATHSPRNGRVPISPPISPSAQPFGAVTAAGPTAAATTSAGGVAAVVMPGGASSGESTSLGSPGPQSNYYFYGPGPTSPSATNTSLGLLSPGPSSPGPDTCASPTSRSPAPGGSSGSAQAKGSTPQQQQVVVAINPLYRVEGGGRRNSLESPGMSPANSPGMRGVMLPMTTNPVAVAAAFNLDEQLQQQQ